MDITGMIDHGRTELEVRFSDGASVVLTRSDVVPGRYFSHRPTGRRLPVRAVRRYQRAAFAAFFQGHPHRIARDADGDLSAHLLPSKLESLS